MREVNFETYEFATPLYALSVALRDQILRAPLGIVFEEEELSEEYAHIHLGGFTEEGRLCACMVLVPLSDKVVKMRQVAVVEDLQSQGLGSKMVQYAENYLTHLGYDIIELNARDNVVEFYKKLGYKVVGDQFVEVGIPHFKMKKNLITP
ncbi:GNAT family N-acetyltransferase [Portibacter marinus]|uniref:GNAT family N-acetyltransferase n=1 Tax=Portibacter marinus TaxID=2898660 RepID=UPI001F2FA34B|nr:GNAT family N-acetyltransferase [Portibacter marinus]